MAERGVPLARKEPGPWLALLLGTRGLLRLRAGEHAGAVSDLVEGVQLCPPFGLDAFACNYFLWAAQASALMGDLGGARRFYADALPLLPEGPTAHAQTRTLTEAVLAFQAGEYARAQGLLEGTSVFSQPWEHARREAYLAELARRQGKLTKGYVDRLLTALDTAGDTALQTDRVVLGGLFDECVRRRWAAERFAPLVPPAEAQPVTLEVVTLGRFGVSVNGVAVEVPLRKSQELLVWLALHGASTRGEIVRALWGEPSEPKHLAYFKAAVRGLRLALMGHAAVSADPLVFARGLYQLHAGLALCLDAGRLQNPDEGELEAVFALYRGDFLPDLDSPWVQDVRRQLQDQAADCAWQLGQRLGPQHPEEASRLFQRAQALNPSVGTGALGSSLQN